ncbi:cytochrome P450 2B4-like isoform X2 [Cervus elaphus]|uniref:cytochrome P450 2B4-like isoform X2 n=1 Tax=Cervus elaphus TaxID=9860 RepID=UPI001CC2DA28|nr:cytochrome P450 2B4-like isoform X2 [Cervus elaphus]
MKDFGMGKWTIEERIKKEAQCLVEELWKSQVPASSAPLSLVFEIFPGILKHFPGTHTCLYSMIQEVKDFITENRERHQKMLDPSGPKDFIDSFLLLMDKLREKYGDVFTVYLGSRPAVILWGYEAMREALVDQAEAFSGRGHIAILDPVFQGTGVVFANGKSWKVLRQFSVTTMKDFGMGKRTIEERIKKEAQCLVEELRKSQGAYLDPHFLFNSISANIICSIVFGERFNYQDPRLLRLLHLLNEIFIILCSFYTQVFEIFPGILKYFPGTHTRLYSMLQEVKDFITENVERHQKMLDPSGPKDFIDSFLLRMDKERSDPESEFHQENLVHTVLSLFFAGTETSSSTLCFGFLLLLKNPDVLEKVQAEIDRVIGAHRLPALEDRPKMPYTDAVIHEIQRFSDLVPVGVPHSVIKDTHFRGYYLPKVRPAGSQILIVGAVCLQSYGSYPVLDYDKNFHFQISMEEKRF